SAAAIAPTVQRSCGRPITGSFLTVELIALWIRLVLLRSRTKASNLTRRPFPIIGQDRPEIDRKLLAADLKPVASAGGAGSGLVPATIVPAASSHYYASPIGRPWMTWTRSSTTAITRRM